MLLAKDVQVGMTIKLEVRRLGLVAVKVREVNQNNGIVAIWYNNPDAWSRGPACSYLQADEVIAQ